MENYFLNQLDFDEMNEYLSSFFQNENPFNALFYKIISGDFDGIKTSLFSLVKEAFFGDLLGIKKLFFAFLFLGLVVFLTESMADLFADGKVVVLARFFITIFASVLFLNCFLSFFSDGYEMMKEVKEFQSIFLPLYCMSVSFSAGFLTAGSYYEFQLCILYVVQICFFLVIMPLLRLYGIFITIDLLSDRKRFEGALKLVRKILTGITKVVFFVSLSGVLMQSSILPGIDNAKTRILIKTVSLIPGIGGNANALVDIAYKSASLIKNGIGITAIVIFVFLCIKPVLRCFLYGFLIKTAAALLQVSGEKNFTNGLSQMGECFLLLSRVELFFDGIFVVSLAVANLGLNGV